MKYTMKQMVENVGVSNTTLKRYENNGLIPSVLYTKGKHRRYEEVHLLAFKTIRSLLQGFDIPVAYQLMKLAKEGNFTEAYWSIAQAQKDLVKKKETLQMHKEFILAFPQKPLKKQSIRIGELAKFADVKSSTIRYWEKRGLIQGIREESSGYRFYDKTEVRKTIIISLLRKSIYKLEDIKDIIEKIDEKNLASIKKHYTIVNDELDNQLAMQLSAISSYMIYCKELSITE
ncbi:MAG: MerR family transcriptional regulator [Tetragenococcus koreensis]|nr:MerR family transcriptional regulator [Tetragenococcus koreensis]MDN6146805.1 MerR family transcriptional regulator [Tetragenococcus koreensis]MDN6270874.1 MerR family transcriptional regulator [Tetragenococcus koreensis]MDN6497866.1 MerR family transcriptional regulator [Tetragenococcus koreensis]MDN6502555.1 MerR family transcriptional regulator [Tetragenococcus koreensis]